MALSNFAFAITFVTAIAGLSIGHFDRVVSASEAGRLTNLWQPAVPSNVRFRGECVAKLF
jgi:hypothetical protein